MKIHHLNFHLLSQITQIILLKCYFYLDIYFHIRNHWAIMISSDCRYSQNKCSPCLQHCLKRLQTPDRKRKYRLKFFPPEKKSKLNKFKTSIEIIMALTLQLLRYAKVLLSFARVQKIWKHLYTHKWIPINFPITFSGVKYGRN